MNPDNLPASPIEDAGFLSKLFFSWLLDFLRLGAKRDLKLSDLYRLSPENKSEKLGNDLSQAWRNQIREAEQCSSVNKDQPQSPSLGKAVLKVFFWEYAVLGVIAFTDECIIKIAQPLLLGLIIRYCGGEFGDVSGYLFGTGLFILSVIYAAQHQPYFYFILVVGMKVRVACSTLIYRKALKLSQAAIGKTNVGQLVNLLSNDVNRFDLAVAFLHYFWVGPIQLILVTYILWGYYGWSCLAGVSVLVLFVPFQSIMGKLFGMLRLQIAERTDRRVRIMSEILNAVRIIKMYAWELPFAKLVGEAREDEIKCIRKAAFLRALNISCYDISAKVVVFLTVLTFVLTGNSLNAEKVFVALSMYNNVRLTMTLFFPSAISQLSEALVSIKRLENFLLMEERVIPSKPIMPIEDSDDCEEIRKIKDGGEIIMTGVNARWSGSTNSDININTLTDISLQVTNGQLVAVVGSIGSGKTSLLQVLLHELPVSSGGLQINGKQAYTCQEPWIFSGSVRDNILFGREYKYDRYIRVIEACALSKDMELFPFQDQTLVGDRGTSLSGGQKARINLARAVYADADIYLLDDPLSAVDAEVTKHIFENCIMGFLKEKAKVLVTHQLQFLKPADEIILLNKGHIEARGSYQELLQTGINFTQALLTDEQSNPKEMNVNEEDRIASTEPLQQIRSESTILTEPYAQENPVKNEESECNDEFQDAKCCDRRYDKNREKRSTNAFGTSLSDPNGESSPVLPQQNEETRSRGKAGLKLYWKYISAGSSWLGILCLTLANILVQLLFSGSDYWLQYWTKEEQRRTVIREEDSNSVNSSNTDYGLPQETNLYKNNTAAYFENISGNSQVYVYCALVGSLFLLSLIKNSAFFNICLNSSVELHRRLFEGVMRAAMQFFEINPSGRVLNRFSKDTGIIDEQLPMTLSDSIQTGLQVLGVIAIVSVNNPYLMLPSLSLPVIFYFARKFYLKTAKSLKHLESTARSPVFSHLSTSLYGLSTIRAMRVENQFERQFDAHQDLHSASWILFLATGKWLAIFIDWCGALYIGVVIFAFLSMKGDDSGSAIGLSIASAMSLSLMLQWGVRQSAEAENQMVSVERVQEYAELEPEGAFDSSTGNKPPSSWPLKGEITFNNVALKYGDDSPVLKNITCVFKSQEKVGIVGRTGSGKSSLLSTLFRITNPCQGDIEIDCWSILKIGLHDLRKKISIIPQDPVLFNSTLRKNLDPFEDHADEELWTVLEQVYLADTVRESPAELSMEISEGGSNLSVGQRQLICLGRALLRKNKILVLDEATANVDHETDALIQKTIREKFATCTVLTIAHRLHTVMDSDRILVLDAGEIKEFDEPYTLLSNDQSALSQLVETTGKATAASLYKMAKAVNKKSIV